MRQWALNQWLTTGITAVAFMALVAPAPAQAQDGPITSDVEVASNTSSAQKLEFGRSALGEIEAADERAAKLVDIAARGNDPDEIKCVKGKQASIKAMHDVAKMAQAAMIDAMGSNPLRVDSEFRKIAVSLSKVRQFIAEAEACVGGAAAVDGSTEIEVSADAVAEGDDTSPLLGADALGGEVNPPQTSPFQ